MKDVVLKPTSIVRLSFTTNDDFDLARGIGLQKKNIRKEQTEKNSFGFVQRIFQMTYSFLFQVFPIKSGSMKWCTPSSSWPLY